jgi:hypothetical protein
MEMGGSSIQKKKKALGCGNQVFGGQKIMLVLIFLMHKVEALSIDYRMHSSVQG